MLLCQSAGPVSMGQVGVNVLLCCSAEVSLRVASPSASAFCSPALLGLQLPQVSVYLTHRPLAIFTQLTLCVSSSEDTVALSN